MKTATFIDNGMNWKNRVVLWDGGNAYKIVKALSHRVNGVKVWTLNLELY